MKDNRLQVTVERLRRYRDEKDRNGLAEAEKALKKYPNSFDVAYDCAILYAMFGLERKEKPLLRRALELLECSQLQLAQNTDPKISESILYGRMAAVLLNLGDAEQAVGLLRAHNAGGMYDDLIGLTLAADCGRPDEALPFLSESLLSHTVSLIQTVMGYCNVYFARRDYRAAGEILRWGSGMLSGLRDGDTASFFDKMNGVLQVCLAEMELCAGDPDAARGALEQAKRLAAQFYRGNRLCFALAVCAALLGGSLNLILSWLLQQLIDTASGVPGALPLGTLTGIAGGFVLLCVLLFLLKYASEPRFIARAMRQYKDFAFQKLTQKSISSFRDESTATYLSALTNDAASIEADCLAQQLALIAKTVAFFGALLLMLWYSPLLTAVAAAATILPLIASLPTGKQVQAAEREILRLFAQSNEALEGEKFSRRKLRMLVSMIGGVTGIIAQLGVFLAGAWLVLAGRGITAGTVILFVNLMNLMIEPVTALPALLAGRRAALGLMDKLAGALEQHAEPAGTATLNSLVRDIRLEDVSFGYEAGKDVLHGITAEFQAGKAYAIVGGSGSGKSTLLHLLMAGTPDYCGRILLDDTELRELAPASLYELMSVIQQNVFVFNASIRDNVSMFRDFPPEALERAIQHAHLNELIAARGSGYLCGENGCGLSGGEKQRVSIARSLLKQSAVLLADEATAALDAETAHQVSGDILDLSGMTRIVVTHTLEEALLRRYDGIFVLRNGSIVESGHFEKLMAQKGYFYALFTVAQ